MVFSTSSKLPKSEGRDLIAEVPSLAAAKKESNYIRATGKTAKAWEKPTGGSLS